MHCIGADQQAFTYTLPTGAEILVANFKDDAFYRFFGKVIMETGSLLNADELVRENCFTDLWTVISRIPDMQERATYILDFCKPYLKERSAMAKQLSSLSDPNLNPIKSVAQLKQQTERNVQLNQRKYFGYTAKEIARYQRFLKAIGLIQQLATGIAKVDWFEVIEQCGYYDQSQLIHDFKHYINLSPTQYLKFQQAICNPLG